MQKRISVAVAGVLTGSMLTVASPAQAQPEVCDSPDPVVAHVCDTVEKVPAWVKHYYAEIGETAYAVYCKLMPPCR